MPINKDELPQVLVNPIPEEDLKQFLDAMNSQEVQAFLREYHKNELLNGAQEVIFTLSTQHPFHLQEILMACIDIWMENLAQLHELFGPAFARRWKAVPDILCRVLLHQSVQALAQFEKELEPQATPEMQEMAKQWVTQIPDTREDEMRPEYRRICFKSLRTFQQHAEGVENLKIGAADYTELWLHLVLQFYTLGFMKNAELYCLLASNWHFFMQGLPSILEALTTLEGYEELLLPENKAQLAKVLMEQQAQLDAERF